MSLSLLQSNVQVSGSSVIYRANFSGIGGTLIQWSGDYILVSGGSQGTIRSGTNLGVGSGLFSGISGTNLQFYSIGATGTNSLVFASNGTLYVNGTGATEAFVTGISGYLQSLIVEANSDVSRLNGLSGVITITGTAGISVITQNQTITISGLDWVTSGTLSQTGQAILGIVAQTGQQAWLAADNNARNLSGIIQQTGSNLYNLIVGFSGLFTGSKLSYVTGVPTGSDVIFFNFLNYTFPSIPKVQITLETAYYNNCGYNVMISGRSITGFYTIWSDIVYNSGYSLNVTAEI